MELWECAQCPDPSKKYSARASSDAGMGKRKPLVLPSESLQSKEGREEGQAKRREHAK